MTRWLAVAALAALSACSSGETGESNEADLKNTANALEIKANAEVDAAVNQIDAETEISAPVSNSAVAK
jgi:uncharacterized lipoprotein